MTLDLISRISGSVAAQKSDWPLYDDEEGRLDRNAVLTASENLRCLRELKFAKSESRQGDRWGMAQRGHAVEAWVVDQIMSSLHFGELVRLAGTRQRSFLCDEAGLSGTPDGLFTKDGAHTLLEFKSADPRTNLEGMTAPKPQHSVRSRRPPNSRQSRRLRLTPLGLSSDVRPRPQSSTVSMATARFFELSC